MAINQVTGTREDGPINYSPTRRFPLCLPIDSLFKANYGMGLKEIQRIVPRFMPKQGLSFFPISEAEYIDLEKKLKIHG